MKKILVILAFLTLYSCSTTHCDNIVTYEEKWPVYTVVNGEYQFVAYTQYTQIMSSCDCLRVANAEAKAYYERLDTMSDAELDFHYHYPSYYSCL